MKANRSITVRTLAATFLAAGMLIGSISGGASADPIGYRGASEDEGVKIAPVPAMVGVAAFQGFVAANEVVLTDFTPEQPRTTVQPGAGSYGIHTALGGGAGHGVPSSYKAGPGCSIQCIKAGVAYARGANAELRVWTDTAAKIVIIVWNDSGYYRSFASSPDKHYFSGLFDDLEPGSEYYAQAFATDGEGYTSDAEGSFETLTRNVEISFTHVDLIQTPFGDDVIKSQIWADGQWTGEGINYWNPEGSTLFLGIDLSLEDVGQYLDLSVELTQLDESAWNDSGLLCQAGLNAEPEIGSAACHAWAYATFEEGLNDLDARPAGATSWTEHTLERTLVLPGGGGALPSGSGQPFDFVVPVTLEVTYN